MLAIATDHGVADLLHDHVSDARCLAQGEAPQVWPTAPVAPLAP